AAGQGPVPDRPGRAYGPARFGPQLQELADRIGINRHARARVGEAYTTQRVDAGRGAQGTHVHFTSPDARVEMHARWPYHYAAVVAESRDRKSQITLENVTRKANAEQLDRQLLDWMRGKFPTEMAAHAQEAAQLLAERFPITAGMQPSQVAYHEEARRTGRIGQLIGRMLAAYEGYERLTLDEARKWYDRMRENTDMEPSRMWYFRMVGPGADTAFYEHDTGEANPLTMVAAALPGAVTVELDAEGREPSDDDVTALSQLADQVTSLVERGLDPGVHVVAEAAGSGGRARRLANDRKKGVADMLGGALDRDRVTAETRTGTGRDRVVVSLSMRR
ncbi:MAG: hypothetical protein HOV94_07840, partial [Saccharothrix sp.]|nr:hypothetical protein [Saccharothrix sp.]